VTGVDISPAADIGPGLKIAHGTGIVVGWRARVGRGCTMMQNVTLAHRRWRGSRRCRRSATASCWRWLRGDRRRQGRRRLLRRRPGPGHEDVPAGTKVLARGGVELRPRGGAGREPA